ncbi:aminoglycoside phosphotransferase family protein [Nisaea nitritireducens]|uniref:aminoglycoside phosphotransferase family protein n=1 Tax=Nisaea nitritireducens TaxID=568392 RepID=UPI001D02B698|nr:phosphotransferase [Nisaea nitritireducens]
MSEMNAVDAREAKRRAFWQRAGWEGAVEGPLAADASFRRYFRLKHADGRAAVVMDAPPEKEDVRPFVSVGEILSGFGYSVPRLLAADDADGFLLLEDLGDTTYTRALAAGQDEHALYSLATDLLTDLARRGLDGVAGNVPAYSDEKLLQEVMLFVDWYLRPGVGLEVDDSAREAFADAWRACLPAARSAPEVLVLRDYHVDNMMLLPDRPGIAACGLLDFQDAVVGPASYDLVSLLQDCRRDISGPVVKSAMERYFAAMPEIVNQQAFLSSYRVLGAQRHFKVLGIFGRQTVLYGNHGYLVHMPRLWRLTLENLSDEALAPVREWIEKHVPESHRVTPPPGGYAA